MIGGFVGRPVACSTGPGSPIPIPARSLDGPPHGCDERPSVIDHPAQHGVGSAGDVQIDELVGEQCGGEVCDGEPDVGCPHVGGENDPCRRIEGELRRRPASRGGGLAGCADESARQEGVDALGDSGPAEPGGGGELAACARHAVAQILQQRAGTVHAESETHGTYLTPEQLLLDKRQKCRMVGAMGVDGLAAALASAHPSTRSDLLGVSRGRTAGPQARPGTGGPD